MTNNFHHIQSLLNFKNEGDFYLIQIIQRRKDNPEIKRNMNLVDNYFVYSKEKLEEYMPKIIKQCDYFNARAYIRVNVRNAERIALQTLNKITQYILTKDYKAVKGAYLSAAGEHHSDDDKKWIVDVDGVSPDSADSDHQQFRANLEQLIESLQPNGKKKIIAEIPTKNGFHLITRPFNMEEFRKMQPLSVDVHKDNPTILYIP
jgi:hypothetical protein